MESNTVWLAVLAISAALQSLMLVAIAIGAFRFYRVATSTIERLEREAVTPLVRQSQRAIERFEGLVDRVEQADDHVREALANTGDRIAAVTSHAKALVRSRFWPVIGIGQAAAAAVSAFMTPGPSRPARVPISRGGRERLRRDEESRFVYEGGIDHARS